MGHDDVHNSQYYKPRGKWTFSMHYLSCNSRYFRNSSKLKQQMHVQLDQNCHYTGIAGYDSEKMRTFGEHVCNGQEWAWVLGNSCLNCTDAHLMTSVNMETDMEARCKAWLSLLSKIKIQNHLFRRNKTFCEVWGQQHFMYLSLALDFLNKLRVSR